MCVSYPRLSVALVLIKCCLFGISTYSVVVFLAQVAVLHSCGCCRSWYKYCVGVMMPGGTRSEDTYGIIRREILSSAIHHRNRPSTVGCTDILQAFPH